MTRSTLLNFIITFLIFSLIIWIRVIKQRETLNLENILFNIFLASVITSFILINLTQLVVSLKTLGLVTKKNSALLTKLLSYNFIEKIKDIVSKIANAPKELYEQLDDTKFPLPFLHTQLASYIAAYIKYYRLLTFLLIFLPQILVVNVFLIDITYFHQLKFFYKSLILLLIPLLTKCYFFITHSSNLGARNFWELHLEITKYPNGINVTLKNEAPIGDNMLTLTAMRENYEFICNSWYICNKLVEYFNNIYQFHDKFQPYIRLYTSLIYIIGWSYYLYILIT